MSKKSKIIAHLFEYVLLKIMCGILMVVPRKVSLMAGQCCGYCLYRLGIYRDIVRKNMEHTGLWDQKEMNRITRSLYGNFGKYVVDFLRPAYPLPRYHLHGYKDIEPVLNDSKGAITILSHIGNWEMLATVFGKMTGRLNVVAKTMSNGFVDKWLLSKRTASSVTTIYSKQALRKMLSVIREGGIIAVLIDQYMNNHGDPVLFLGKPAKTVNTVAGLVQKTGCNVLSAKAIMRSSGEYDIYLYSIVAGKFAATSDEEKIDALQTLHNSILSDQIIEHPEHWFSWFHKRFRGYVDYGK